MSDHNRYLFHWLPLDSLLKFDGSGFLKPSWRHFILDRQAFVRGTSSCEEPMLWSPDEELPREPCIVLDRSLIDGEIIPIASGPTYHLTKEVKSVMRRNGDLAELLEQKRLMARSTICTPDEFFISCVLTWNAVVAIGFEDDHSAECEMLIQRVHGLARSRGVQVIDMTGWSVGNPGWRETDGIIDELCAGTTLALL